MITFKRIIGIIVFLVLFAAALCACRYTVRETGYSDIASRPYILHFFIDNSTPEETVSSFQRISRALLVDTNIKSRIINVDNPDDEGNVDKQTDIWGPDFLRDAGADSLPAALLVSPRNLPFLLPFNAGKGTVKEAVWELIENTVTSKTREELLKLMDRCFAVVLVVEGKAGGRNEAVKKNITEAIYEIKKIADFLPKPVKAPVRMVVVPHHRRSEEIVLLRSLGMDTGAGATDVPSVTVLYGRGRRMGPVLTGDGITVRKILNLFSIVGADCECGLDNSWKLGTMIPLRWDYTMQKRVAGQLGFDVENPMIKSEMSRILSVDRGDAARKKHVNPLENNILEKDGMWEKVMESPSVEGLLVYRRTLYILIIIFLFILVITGAIYRIRKK